MKTTRLNLSHSLTLAMLALVGISQPASAVDLNFSSFSPATDSFNASLGPYYSGSSMDFYNVATVGALSVDMRLTVSTNGPYSIIGEFPNYSQNVVGEPAGDLGIYYRADAAGLGSATYTMSFFDHSSNFTTPVVISSLSMLAYDVDGESWQSEAVRAYYADGFVSYNVGTAPAHLVADVQSDSVLFSGPGYNTAETDPTAAVILNFENTSQIRFAFEANTINTSPLPNPVFSGIDGDLSMLHGDLSGFGSATPVPEPSGALLVMASCSGLFLVRRRKSRN
jgi:hypothetical protein